MSARAVLAVLLSAAMSAPPAFAADAPTVTARASKTDVSVGETFVVEVKATGPAGATFTFPAQQVEETFEMRPAPPAPEPAAKSGSPSSAPPDPGTFRYQAAVFALGDAQVPPIAVGYRLADGTTGEMQTQPIKLQVRSLLPREKEEQKLADVRPPVPLSIGRAFWFALAALAVAIAALVWWLIARRRRRATLLEAPAIPVVEPDIEARLALDALVASGRLAREEYRLFYIELTAIAKRYLERRLEAPIVEMTTAEMLSHLRASPHGVEMTPLLRDLAGAADQIKFARGSGLAQEAERHLAATRSLVDSLETRLRPPATEGGRAA